MLKRKLTLADFLFGSQLGLALAFGTARIVRMQQTLQGVAISEFILIGAFCLLNLRLATGAYRKRQDRLRWQTRFTYGLWSVILVACTVSVLIRGGYLWSESDTIALLLAAIGGLGVVLVGWFKYHLPVSDQVVRGCLAMLFKAWPQVILAYKISQQGGAGLPLLAIVLGHATITIRLTQIIMGAVKGGWDRNQVGMLISELGNELTWIAVTVVWLAN